MQTLISASQLLADSKRGKVRVIDCRFSLQDPRAGARAYAEGHIPGAIHADMERDLSSAPVEGISGRHPLPDRKQWLQTVAGWGLHPDLDVVAYDDVGGAGAARLWWLLLWIGHERVRVLDGGWQAWLAAGGEVSTQSAAQIGAAFAPYKGRVALTREVNAEQINTAAQVLVDARDEARFRGEVEPIDPVAGHIPGAVCLPFNQNLDDGGRFRSAAELRERFAVLDGSDRPVVNYCGSGVTACHNILAMVHAGLDMPALYPGSWSEWITDPNRPVATGP